MKKVIFHFVLFLGFTLPCYAVPTWYKTWFEQATPEARITALKNAVMFNRLPETQYLLSLGINPNEEVPVALDPGFSRQKQVPLLFLTKNPEMAKILVQGGANVNIISSNNETALCRAAFKGNFLLVTTLLGLGADPELYGIRVDGVAKNFFDLARDKPVYAEIY